jgi:hypothetical protein
VVSYYKKIKIKLFESKVLGETFGRKKDEVDQ